MITPTDAAPLVALNDLVRKRLAAEQRQDAPAVAALTALILEARRLLREALPCNRR